MLALTWNLPFYGWVAAVRQQMAAVVPGPSFADLLSHPDFADDAIQSARHCKVQRRLVLRRYCSSVALPALRERDMRLYLQSGSTVISSLGFCRSSLLPEPEVPSSVLLDMNLGPHTWRFYRSWSIIRISGDWPTTCYASAQLDPVLATCPLCGADAVSVVHCLCHCPGTSGFFGKLCSMCSSPPRAAVPALLWLLFGPTSNLADCLLHIRFVGECIHAALSSSGVAEDRLQDVEAFRAESSDEEL